MSGFFLSYKDNYISRNSFLKNSLKNLGQNKLDPASLREKYLWYINLSKVRKMHTYIFQISLNLRYDLQSFSINLKMFR